MISTVDDILKRIEVRRSFKNHLLTLDEQGFVEVHSDDAWETLSSIDSGALERLALSLDVRLRDGKPHNIIKSGNVVGSARLASDHGMLSIIVEPKVPANRLVAILEYVENGKAFDDTSAEAYGAHSDILTIQICRCVKLIHASLASGTIREYQKITERLDFLKGRPNFVSWLKDSVYFVPLSISCTFDEHTINTLRNQVYRAALVKCAKILSERDVPDVLSAARLVLYSLSGVEGREFKSADIDAIARANPRDAPALLACGDVICGLSISPHPGLAKEFFSYAVNMATLFENYCIRLMSVALKEHSVDRVDELVFTIPGSNQTIRLDGLFGEKPAQVLVECKYKVVRSVSDLLRSDIYQVVSYCCHIDLEPILAIILVPSFGGEEPVSVLGAIGGFRVAAGGIYVLSISLTHSPSAIQRALALNIPALLTEQRSLLCADA